MCDAVMMGHIEDVIEKFVDEQRMFTAYDVTCEIRTNVGRGVNVKHNDIKNDIHKEMAQHLDSDWQKTLQDVGAAVSAFVYYHFMSDPTTYEPQSRGSAPAVPATDGNHQHSAPSAASTAATVGSSDAFAVDGRSRLLIPTSFMQHLGVEGGDEVKVYKELDSLVVSKDDQQLRELASLKVDRHGYLYLSAKILGQGDLGDAQKFDVETTDNGVEVKKA
jgi:bifunctional DNA-binding transcriptional regulator/antitoxin component of YhaV-PrlF toxin-antitoxin module